MYLAFRSSSDCVALAAPALALPDDESGGEGNRDAAAAVSSAGGAFAVVEAAENLGDASEDCCRPAEGWFRGVELLEWLLDR